MKESRQDCLKQLLLGGASLLAASASDTSEQVPVAGAARTRKQQSQQTYAATRDRRMAWRRGARFGMFMHFGLYSVPSRGAWVMAIEEIPAQKYAELAAGFDPAPGCTRGWVRAARDAGMKYMALMTKHHEGFCLGDTNLTDYSAVKMGPKRDIIDEYVEPARTEGYESERLNSMVFELQHSIAINNRSGLPGDFNPQGQSTNPGTRDWVSCMTLNDSWSYVRANHNWKSVRAVISNLVKCSMFGGNYLLGVGPMPDDRLPDERLNLLDGVGEWMRRYGNSIYGSSASARLLTAQAATTGYIQGILKDPSGAFVPNTTLTVLNVTSGFTLTSQSNGSGTCIFVNPYPAGFQKDVQHWFNAAAFSAAGLNNSAFQPGDTARNPLRGPAYDNSDLSLFKVFGFHSEQYHLQTRFEMFNAFSHPNFVNPNSNLGQVNVGTITNTTGNPRVFQFAARLLF